jgi:hypothetical protein
MSGEATKKAAINTDRLGICSAILPFLSPLKEEEEASTYRNFQPNVITTGR